MAKPAWTYSLLHLAAGRAGWPHCNCGER